MSVPRMQMNEHNLCHYTQNTNRNPIRVFFVSSRNENIVYL